MFDNTKNPLADTYKEMLEGSKAAYKKFFDSALKKFDINSPADLKTPEEKKKFYDYVDANWEGENEEPEDEDEKKNESIKEGTWQLPDTPKLMADLKKLMSKPIKLGLDGHKAIDDLQAVVGDDELFDDLYVAGKKNAMGDARGVVKKHMKRLGIKEELEEASKLHPDLVAIDKEIDAFHAKTKQHKYLRVAGSARKDADILAKLVKKRDDIYNNIKEEVELEEATNWKKGDGRPKGGSSIENVKFWDLPDASLKYIQKDASDAVKANPEGKKSGKYADEVNDAGTVLFWRKKNNIVVEEAVMEAMTNLHPAVGKAFLKDLTQRVSLLKTEVTGNTNNIIGSIDSLVSLCNAYKSKL